MAEGLFASADMAASRARGAISSFLSYLANSYPSPRDFSPFPAFRALSALLSPLLSPLFSLFPSLPPALAHPVSSLSHGITLRVLPSRLLPITNYLLSPPFLYTFLLTSVYALLLFFLFRLITSPARRLRHIPGPPSRFLVGNIPDIASREFHVCHMAWARQYGALYKYMMGPHPMVIVSSPELAREVCERRFDAFHDRFELTPNEFTADKIIFGKGNYWRRVRAAVVPLFHSSRLASYSPLMNECMDDLLRKLDSLAQGSLSTTSPSLQQEPQMKQQALKPQEPQTEEGGASPLAEPPASPPPPLEPTSPAAFEPAHAGIQAESTPQSELTETARTGMGMRTGKGMAATAEETSPKKEVGPAAEDAGKSGASGAKGESREGGDGGGYVDVSPLFHHASVDVVGSAVFGRRFSTYDGGKLADALQTILEQFNISGSKAPWSAPVQLFHLPLGILVRRFLECIPGTPERAGWLARQYTAAAVLACRDSSQSEGASAAGAEGGECTAGAQAAEAAAAVVGGEEREKEKPDFISWLSNKTRLDDGSKLTLKQVQAVAMEMVLAGSETAATTLGFIVYYVAKNPQVEALLLKEVNTTIPDKRPSYEDLHLFTYTDAVVKETLRIVPPAPNIARQATFDTTLDGRAIPKGTRFFVDAYSIHHDPKLFAEPDAFKPERFLPGGEALGENRPPCAYIPFGAGPRKCLGYKLAIQQLMIGVVRIYRRFVFRLSEKQMQEEVPNLRLGVSMAAVDGIQVADGDDGCEHLRDGTRLELTQSLSCTGLAAPVKVVDVLWHYDAGIGADDGVQDAEEGWRAEGDAGAEGGTEADTEAATEAGTAEDVFPKGAPGGDDDDDVEYWSRDGLPEKLPIPTYPPRNRKRPHPSSQNRDSRPPSPRHKPNDHKRQAYTAAEKLKWVAQLDVAVSVRALARESGIHRKCLANWKRAADFLKEAHSARCRMHGRGRASWYRPMEIKVYERLLDWRRKGTAMSIGRLQEWSREFMKILYPLVKWKGSQRWSDRFHVAEQCKNLWQFVSDKHRERDIKTTWIINADQTPLWLEMPTTTTVDQTGVRLVPIRSAGYQKERVTVMLACTAVGMKLRPWVFFKRKTVPKGCSRRKLVCYADVVVSCHENGWMDANGVIQWLEECVKPFLKPEFGRHARSLMVVLESYRGHLTEAVKEKFRELNCMPAIIPSGCTAEVQPLDVSINKSFKASVRQQYQKWFQEEGQEQLTRAVPANLIKRAFLTCGISNALDGSEDGLAMAHRRSRLTTEVDVDDSIIADGFFGNNCQEPESDEE
ncbi:unnamed protein product [Closterium sp. NIES-54]